MGIFFAVTFVFWRLLEIVTLIPILGMLAYFVDIWTSVNALTPTYVVLGFVISVLATFYAIFTLFSYHRSRRNAVFISFLDLCFVGAFIATAYELRFITNTSCANVQDDPNNRLSVVLGADGKTEVNGVRVNAKRDCEMLKAVFALAIINAVFFFLTSLLVACVGSEKARGRENRSRSRSGVVEEETTVRRSHSGRRRSDGDHGRGPRRAYV